MKITKMITRQEYLKDSAALHNAYYLQYATAQTRQEILSSIGIDNLLSSKDPHLNDVKIPFNNMSSGGNWWWDTVTVNISLLRTLGDRNTSMLHTCVGKSVARVLIQEHLDAQKELL